MNEMTPATIGDNSRIRAYDPLRKEVEGLKKQAAEKAFDYEDPEGNKDARSYVHSLRKVKGELDRVRKAEKAESLALGRRIDAQAAEIESEIEALIQVHQAKIDEIKAREEARVKKHEDHIAAIETAGRGASEAWVSQPLDLMQTRLAEIEEESKADPATFEEFAPLYQRAFDTSLLHLRDAIAKREKHDAEQAELAKLRKEAEDRKREEEAERLRKEGEERARRQAEADAKERERLAEEGRQRAEQERIAAAERQERAAEQERQAAARREQELKEQAEKAERLEAEEQRRREANKRHRAGINNAAKQAFMKGGLSEKDAETAVTLIAAKKIPNVTVAY